MTRRRDLVRILKAAGFEEDRGIKHERFRNRQDGRIVFAPRHREIKNRMARTILREAGIR